MPEVALADLLPARKAVQEWVAKCQPYGQQSLACGRLAAALEAFSLEVTGMPLLDRPPAHLPTWSWAPPERGPSIESLALERKRADARRAATRAAQEQDREQASPGILLIERDSKDLF